MQNMLVAALMLIAAGFASVATSVSGQRATIQQVVPTRYDNGRFFAVPVTVQGQVLTLFLDTGGGTFFFRPAVERFHLLTESITTADGARRDATPFPAFKTGSELPEPATATPQGKRLLVSDAQAGLNQAIMREADGQLGRFWFGDQVWT